MGEMNYVLDRSGFEEQIVRMIPKAENTSEHENQSNTTSNMVRVIKAIKAMRSNDMARAIQSAIRSAIKAIWPAIQSGGTRRWLHC